MAPLSLNLRRPGLPWLVASLALAWFAAQLRAATPPVPVDRGNEVKAAALYNIIAFTEWPANAFAYPEAPLVIGVLGQGPVAAVLSDLAQNETWRGRRLVLRQISTIPEAHSCHVVWIARSEQSRWPALVAQFARQAILTVSDEPNFARSGGIVQFSIERNKLHLLVNLAAARGCGVQISSKVLRLAEVIDDRGS